MGFVDCPGGGTPQFPARTYVKDMGLRYYDIALFFCNTRFQTADLEIINDCKRNKVTYFAVKTMVQQSLDALERDRGDDADNYTDEDRKQMLRDSLAYYTDGN